MKIRLGHYVFTLSIIPAMVFIGLLYLLISLGFWQLGRADQKITLIDQQSRRSKDKIIDLTWEAANEGDELRYRNARVFGKYDQNRQFLIDNQVVEGKAGYFVMTPLLLEGSNIAILVNRGWVPLNDNRSTLPDISIQVKEAVIEGRINYFPSVGFKLKGAEIPADGWPSVVQVVDHTVLQEKLGYTLFPYQLELDKDQENGFRREWRNAVTVTPEKHKAYAFQWFGLAVTWVILFFWVSSKKKLDE